MFYTIYKITNLINGKYYIGKHQTTILDDGYMGSGKILKRAITKYGIENFCKEILYVFDSEEEMNSKEKELIIISESTYNLHEGGHGGFGYINSNNLAVKHFTKDNAKEYSKKANQVLQHKREVDSQWNLEYKRKMSESRSGEKNHNYGKPAWNKGKRFSNETKEKMKIASLKRETERKLNGYYKK